MTSQDLLQSVKSVLIPEAAPVSLRIDRHERGEAFGDELVILNAPSFRVRVVRDRGKVFADFGSDAATNTWYDSAVIMEQFGLSADAGFHGEDVAEVLRAVGKFIHAMSRELTGLFDPGAFAKNKAHLSMIQKRQAEQLLGVRLPDSSRS